MTTIGPASNQTSQPLAATQSADAAKTSSTPNSTNKASNDIDLSSRASKMQKLNEEFFPGGPKQSRSPLNL
jgi:hypothetical protein